MHGLLKCFLSAIDDCFKSVIKLFGMIEESKLEKKKEESQGRINWRDGDDKVKVMSFQRQFAKINHYISGHKN